MVVRQFLVESLLFSTIAGAAGLLLAMWALGALQSSVASQLPPSTVLALNWRALIMRSGLWLVGAGLLLGLAGAAGTSRLIRQLLFGVAPLSPIIYIGVAVLFGAVAALACLGPSLRASRIDPLTAFRAD